MKKTILSCLLAVSVITATAQTNKPIIKTKAAKALTTFTIPNPLPEYSGTYESFSAHHYFYPNTGEILHSDETQSAADEVSYYTQFTHPRQYVLNTTKLAFVMAKSDTSKLFTGQDSLHRITLDYVNHISTAVTLPVDTQSNSKLNYFLSSIGSNIVDVHGSAALVTQGVYNNIDMVYTSNSAGLKIFFVVWPTGDPNDIELQFTGAKNTNLNSGILEVNANFDGFQFDSPLTYQYNISGNVVTTYTTGGSSWSSVGSDTYKINTGTYDNAAPLIILVRQGAAVVTTGTNNIKWSTYFGGNSDDVIFRTKSDANNNLITCGGTISSNFPQGNGASGMISQISAGSWDGFVAKFKPTGELWWTTYIGGAKKDKLFDFDFDPISGDIYCIGITTSSVMPLANKGGGAYYKSTFEGPLNSAQGDLDDAFILQMNSNGTQKKWLTYYGGNKEDELRGCKFDATGNFFVVGHSQSTNIPVVAAAWSYGQTYNTAQLAQVSSGGIDDAIIARFKTGTSALEWATYYGTDINTGTTRISDDVFYNLAIEPNNGIVYVAGRSGGINLPGKFNNYYNASNTDGIVVAFSNYGALMGSRYTQGNESNFGVKLHPNNGLVYLCGTGFSNMVGVNSGKYYYDGTCLSGDNDATFMVLSGDIQTVHHATFIGGKAYDAALDMQVDPYGIIYISGGTLSSDFPTNNFGGNTYYSAFNGPNNYRTDYFLTVVKEFNTTLIWSTCLGTNSEETDFAGAASVMALDGNNNLHLCGLSASASGFPVDNGGGPPVYFQSVRAGGYDDATITRFDMMALQLAVGIQEKNLESISIGLYPNPTANYLTINDARLNNNSFSYIVSNALGQVVREGKLNSDSKTINVVGLENGIYIINFNSNDKNYSSKFIKVND